MREGGEAARSPLPTARAPRCRRSPALGPSPVSPGPQIAASTASGHETPRERIGARGITAHRLRKAAVLCDPPPRRLPPRARCWRSAQSRCFRPASLAAGAATQEASKAAQGRCSRRRLPPGAASAHRELAVAVGNVLAVGLAECRHHVAQRGERAVDVGQLARVALSDRLTDHPPLFRAGEVNLRRGKCR